MVLFNAGRAPEARAHLEKVILALPSPTDFTWYSLGRMRRLMGDAREALAAQEQALALNPEYPDALIEALAACQTLGERGSRRGATCGVRHSSVSSIRKRGWEAKSRGLDGYREWP